MAGMARKRASIYDLLVMVFGCVPDSETARRFRETGFQGIIQAFKEAGPKKLKKAAAKVEAYLAKMQGRNETAILEELAVDRTMLVRAPGETDFKAPYEGLYKKERSKGGAPLSVKTFYRKAGVVPDEDTNESPDYLCLELDFMGRLCRREAEQWKSGESPAETIRLENEFISEHLGSWIEGYCDSAAKKAGTDFYRGCLELMKLTVAGDREILGVMVEQLNEKENTR